MSTRNGPLVTPILSVAISQAWFTVIVGQGSLIRADTLRK